MSYKTPIIPNLTLKGLDKKIQDIQIAMDADLSWLDKSFGLADRIVERKGEEDIIYPAVFETNKVDPIALLPGDVWKSFSFWVRNGDYSFESDREFAPKNPIITVPVSCIFYMDIHRISSASYKETKSKITEDIFNFFNKLQGVRLEPDAFIEDDIVEIFKGYTLDQIDNAHKIYPKWACRFDFELSFRDTCYSTNTYSI